LAFSAKDGKALSPYLPLTRPENREAARRLHLVEIVGVDRRYQRQDAPEVRTRRLEREVEADPLARRLGRAGDAELEVVEAEVGLLEDVGLVRQIGLDVRDQAELHPVEIGDTGKDHAHGVGVEPGLDIHLLLAEVAGERLVIALECRLELGPAVVEGDGGVLDLEAAQADRHRLGGGLRLRGGFLGDIPVGAAVLQRDQGEPRLIQLDAADDDGTAPAHDITEHAGQAE
jgi:hypothetical protein